MRRGEGNPPRLLVKTLAVTFLTVSALLVVVFALVTMRARDQVRQRAGPVEDADVRRHTVGHLLAAVGVDGQVTGQLALEAVSDEQRRRGQGDERTQRVGPAAADLPEMFSAHARSTTTGAWSDAPAPALSSRSMNARNRSRKS